MDPGPLPPHERPWRHPSELGPPVHEPAASGARVLIVSTATLSLLLVGLLVIAITPSSSGSDADGVTTVAAVRADQANAVRLELATPVVAPVGAHGLALTTRSAIGSAADGDHVSVQLPSGDVVDAEVLSVDDERGLAVVSIPDDVTTETFAVADSEPADLAPDDTVMVHGDEPAVMSLAALQATVVDEGTPVTDGDGNLLGLCTVEADATTLMAADATAIATPTTSVATTTPGTEDQPAPSAPVTDGSAGATTSGPD